MARLRSYNRNLPGVSGPGEKEGGVSREASRIQTPGSPTPHPSPKETKAEETGQEPARLKMGVLEPRIRV